MDDLLVKHQLQQRCLADDGEWWWDEAAVDVGLLSMLPLAVFFWARFCFFCFFNPAGSFSRETAFLFRMFWRFKRLKLEQDSFWLLYCFLGTTKGNNSINKISAQVFKTARHVVSREFHIWCIVFFFKKKYEYVLFNTTLLRFFVLFCLLRWRQEHLASINSVGILWTWQINLKSRLDI